MRYKSKPVSHEEIKALESEQHSDAPSSPNGELPRFRESLRLASVGADAKARLNAEINRYLGASYRYGGQDETGFDCSGFTGKVFRDALKVELPRSSAAQAQVGTPVELRDLQFGDLVFFNIYGKGISHVGIYIGDGNFVHASTKIGITVSNLQERYYKQRYVTARRIIQF
ncbi:MAG: NlpC/P60 family protein [Chloroherpetonaceae bacterium]|nr:NlpC/P60 family protein [Chloroherpetonaceae bacterium]MCS7212444.1 NlpC/P60 family protein [Chloroherpetonaceae bacterium]MDW8020679.1 NlpC/P60 family protein [Chloroherpetonaceae bacterium]MDW8465509.1 NlpC/P60 family protein [Chloroherpetonaceae bacterium]